MGANGVTPYNVKQGQVGNIRKEVQTVTAAGTISVGSNALVVLNNAANIAVTIANAPEVGDSLTIYCLNTSTATTVTLPSGVTYDGTNNIATFDADGEKIELIALSATRYLVIANADTVVFSS